MSAGKKTAHRVAATMIVVKVPGAQGGEVYLRRGRVLPASVTADEVKRLLDLGLVEPFTPSTDVGSADAGEVEIPEGDPSEEWTAKQLDAFAKAKGIDLGAAKSKPEKVAAIVEAITKPSE